MAKLTNEHLLEVMSLYRGSGETWPASARDMVKWGLKTGHIDTRPEAVESYFADRMSQAMREVYFNDERGKRIRALHAAKDAQGVLWDDIRGEPSPARTKHFSISFQSRRKQIVQDCHQLKLDVDYFNRRHQPTIPIQLYLDFTDDVAEIEALEDSVAVAA